MVKTNKSKEICIIGGGAVGIGIAKSLIQGGILDFDLLEKENDLGGLWAWGTKAGKVYESTHLISSKRNTEFSDYPMPSDYPVFPSHSQFLSYLRELAKHFGIYKHTQFQTIVEKMEPQEESWKLTLSSGEQRVYSVVIIANGRLGQAIYPKSPGRFRKKIMHASDYQSADVLRHKKVLIVGAGNSGCDIAVDSAYYAEKTYLSMRRPYYYIPKFIDGLPYQDWLMEKSGEFDSTEDLWNHAIKLFKLAGYDPTDYGLPQPDYRIDQTHPIVNSQVLYHIGHGSVIAKPDIEKLGSKRVYFQDKSEEEIDLIIYATGYDMKLPFLDDEVIDWQEDGMPNCFLHSFHRNYDNLIFAGYINAASGLGNLVNSSGKMLVAYLQARAQKTNAYHVFRQLQQGPNPDLGQDHFLKTPRHKYEVDLWKLLKTIHLLTNKLKA